MEVLMLGGIIIAIGMLVASSRQLASTDDGLQQAYLFTGLALTLFAVGAFSVGRVLLGLAFDNTLDMGYLTMGGWIFAVPLILAFLFGFSRRRKIQKTNYQFSNTRYPWM